MPPRSQVLHGALLLTLLAIRDCPHVTSRAVRPTRPSVAARLESQGTAVGDDLLFSNSVDGDPHSWLPAVVDVRLTSSLNPVSRESPFFCLSLQASL